MKLSEAILLGRNLVTPKRFALANDEARGYGCALTMAAYAIGGTALEDAFIRWTWLEHNRHGDEIAAMFDDEVMDGRMTLEQLVDYVRSIEPAEEPEVDPRDEEGSDVKPELERYRA